MDNRVPVELIAAKIFEIRGSKVMLDKHLALLYGVKSTALRQQVKRNPRRFPYDFMFQLTKVEALSLVSQNVIPSISSLGGFMPYVFTEQGIAMLSSVLNSERAIQVNILIMRAFIRLKEALLTHKALALKIEKLESKYAECDEKIKAIFDAIKQLLQPKSADDRRIIGFTKR